MIIFLSLFLSFLSANAVANSSNNLPTAIEVWRYNSPSPGFNSPMFLHLENRDGGGWTTVRGGLHDGIEHASSYGFFDSIDTENQPNPGNLDHQTLKAQGIKCEDLLAQNQSFPLSLMRKIQYHSEEQSLEQREVYKNLKPEQITFLEAGTTYSEKEFQEKFSEPPIHSRTIQKENLETEYFVKTASTWLVAGQTLQQGISKLPLETENLLQPIDRTKYPLIFEIGRAAQIEHGHFLKLLPVLATLALQEVLAQGGKIEEAYLFAHSLGSVKDKTFSQSRARLYQMMGMEFYSGYKNLPEESTLVVPLKKMLEAFPPSETFAFIKDIKTITGDSIPDADLMQLLNIQNMLSEGSFGKIKFRSFSEKLLLFIFNRELAAYTLSENQKTALLKKLASPRVYSTYFKDKIHSYNREFSSFNFPSYTNFTRKEYNPNRRGLISYLYRHEAIEIMSPETLSDEDIFEFLNFLKDKFQLTDEILLDISLAYVGGTKYVGKIAPTPNIFYPREDSEILFNFDPICMRTRISRFSTLRINVNPDNGFVISKNIHHILAKQSSKPHENKNSEALKKMKEDALKSPYLLFPFIPQQRAKDRKQYYQAPPKSFIRSNRFV